jgi:hypothetical protein
MTPQLRLEKYQTNMKSWISENISNAQLVAKWARHTDKLASNMLKAYNRLVCGFFDESIQHGGPDPNPELRPNGKPRNQRKRRQAEEETSVTRYDESNPTKGLKQITNSLREWASRHINECYGQRTFDHINKRMDNFVRKVLQNALLKIFERSNSLDSLGRKPLLKTRLVK